MLLLQGISAKEVGERTQVSKYEFCSKSCRLIDLSYIL